MLEPQTRTLLGDGLRPPPGYALDCAVGTTYTLDLLALLTVPLAFTFFEWGESAGAASPLALLEAVRRHASRLAIFCQQDRIAIPKEHQRLFAYIEHSVVPVRPPRNGAFHPKVWALRFVAPGQPVRYRLLVLSRNLTFDRSWDTILALDGELVDRKYAFAQNHPLADFFKALGPMSSIPLPDALRENLERVQDELRRVRFVPPDGLTGPRFWPLGIAGYRSWPFEKARIDRLLVISRFVSDGCLKRLSSRGKQNVLISDFDTLAGVATSTLGGFERVMVLSEVAEPEAGEFEEIGSGNGSRETLETPLTGLHAKVYVADSGSQARLWTGSANATDAAFRANVEFMVELEGKKALCGVDAVLGSNDERQGLISLLVDYSPGESVEADPLHEKLERALEEAREAISGAGFMALVVAADEETYAVELVLPEGAAVRLPEAVTAACRPITIASSTGIPPGLAGPATVARFGEISLEALTSFFAVDLKATDQGKSLSTGFVLNVPLSGAPEDRDERLLTLILRNRDEVRRYMLLLLSEVASTPGEVMAVARALVAGEPSDGGSGESGFPLFEVMLRALRRSPDSLDRVAALIADLARTPGGRGLLPEGLNTVWEPIWSVRQELRNAPPPEA